ncbi:YkyB-like protein [Salinibacillus kushneri]|uniref:YkyB-like protein n=1 Tax=Salinibacillus kushneri TaxID=237682 RepID=A0A1I0IA21_9BACI|nr:YkyB family protein [Salinibacillus kushneri]SET92761.1 YkyB-like protein [Salinibacillus kushneri]
MKQDDQPITTRQIAEALAVVNRHAKAAPDPRQLYTLKQKAIQKLFAENKAKKIGLHYSNHPKFSQQHSTLLIQVDNYYFHIPPKRDDFKQYKHLGALDESYRNPKPNLNLRKAKKILYSYLGWKPEPAKHRYPAYQQKASTWLGNGRRKTSRSYFDR